MNYPPCPYCHKPLDQHNKYYAARQCSRHGHITVICALGYLMTMTAWNKRKEWDWILQGNYFDDKYQKHLVQAEFLRDGTFRLIHRCPQLCPHIDLPSYPIFHPSQFQERIDKIYKLKAFL